MMKKILALFLILVLCTPTLLAQSVEDAKQAVADAEDELADAKSLWQAAQPVNLFDKEEKEAGFVLMKDVWVKTGTVVQKKLLVAKAEVNSEPKIADSLKTEIGYGVDDLVSDIEEWKTDVEESETLLAFLLTLKDIKELWQEFVWKARRYYGLVVMSHTDVTVEKGLEIKQVLREKIDELETQGKDTSELEDIYLDFEENMADVEDHADEARGLIESIDEFDGSGVTFAEARLEFAKGVEAARKVHQNLRDAQKALYAAVK